MSLFARPDGSANILAKTSLNIFVMETHIPLMYLLPLLLLAAILLTYITHDPMRRAGDLRPERKRKKVRRAKMRPHPQQPYLLENGTVILASERPRPAHAPEPFSH